MNQLDMQTFLLIGTGILIVLVLIWLLGLRRQATSEPPVQSFAAQEEQASNELVIRREAGPEVESRRRAADGANIRPYPNLNGGRSEAPISVPARVSNPGPRYGEPRYETRNGEGLGLTSERSPALRQADRVALATEPARFGDDEVSGLRSRWGMLQSQFVDEPRESVEAADQLVSEAMEQVEELFAAQRTNLKHNWDVADEVSTDELRTVLRGYRSFFERLLAA